jgi:hypothetical protein
MTITLITLAATGFELPWFNLVQIPALDARW